MLRYYCIFLYYGYKCFTEYLVRTLVQIQTSPPLFKFMGMNRFDLLIKVKTYFGIIPPLSGYFK